MIFVFGSNLKGVHGAGAALAARVHHGAVMGQGEGLQGNSYALPTCSAPGAPLELSAIQYFAKKFLTFATEHPEMQFQLTAVGCGIAGFFPQDIAPLFLDAPENVWLPAQFYKAVYWDGYRQRAKDDGSYV